MAYRWSVPSRLASVVVPVRVQRIKRDAGHVRARGTIAIDARHVSHIAEAIAHAKVLRLYSQDRPLRSSRYLLRSSAHGQRPAMRTIIASTKGASSASRGVRKTIQAKRASVLVIMPNQ